MNDTSHSNLWSILFCENGKLDWILLSIYSLTLHLFIFRMVLNAEKISQSELMWKIGSIRPKLDYFHKINSSSNKQTNKCCTFLLAILQNTHIPPPKTKRKTTIAFKTIGTNSQPNTKTSDILQIATNRQM